MTTPATGEDYEAALAEEYGRYRAKEVIYIDGARAFNPGHMVPISHVKNKLVNLAQVDDLNKKG